MNEMPPEIAEALAAGLIDEATAAEMLQEMADRRRSRLAELVKRVESCRDKCITDKLPIEQRWVDDCKRIRGELDYGGAATKEFPVPSTSGDQHPVLGYVKARCDQVAARIADMMFPHNDRNWDMETSPDPDFGSRAEQMAQQAGLDPAAIEAELRKHADDACMRMRMIIDDQLSECRFNTLGRRGVDDCVKLGSAVFEGPVLKLKRRMRFDAGQMKLEIQESAVPGVEHIDPWHFFPEMVPSMEECTHAHVFYLYSRPRLEELLDDEFFDQDALKRVLKEEADVGAHVKGIVNRRCQAMGQTESLSERYAIWKSYKFLDAEEMALLDDRAGDEYQVSADGCEYYERSRLFEIWHCNGIALKIRRPQLASDIRLPIYVVPYNRSDDTMFGHGVSYLLRHRDRDIQACWRSFLHNLAMSAGPLVFIRKDSWEPADGSHVIRGPKVILVTDEHGQMPMSDLVRVEAFANNAAQHIQALDRSIALADEEIGMPAIMSGAPSQAVPTSSGLALLMNASNIVQRQFAKAFDDYLLGPLIERFYWWNMLHGDDERAKGDFDVLPLGTSQLLVKDIQAQHLQIFTQMADDPRFAPYIDNYNLLQLHLKMLDMPTDALVKSREQAEDEMKNQPEPPELAKLRAEMEFKAQQLDAERQNAERDDDFRTQDRILKHEEFQQEQETKRMLAQAQLQAAMLDLEARYGSSADAESTRAAIEQQRDETRRIIAGIQARIAAQREANHRAEMALKLNPANQSGTGV